MNCIHNYLVVVITKLKMETMRSRSPRQCEIVVFFHLRCVVVLYVMTILLLLANNSNYYRVFSRSHSLANTYQWSQC